MVVFIDDILVYSKSDEEHARHLRVVLQTLQENELYAKLSKYEFWLREVSFFGNVIFSYGISFDPSKFNVVLQWEIPKSVTKIKSCMGLVGYYRRLFEVSFSFDSVDSERSGYVWDVQCE